MEINETRGKQKIESFIRLACESRAYTGEDIVGIFAPILAQMEQIHAENKIGLSRGLESFTVTETDRLRIDEQLAKDVTLDLPAINKILPDESGSFDIIAEQKLTTDLTKNVTKWDDQNTAEEIPEHILAPIFIPAYKSYESLLGHHDQMTDLHVLGLIMASLVFSINLTEKSGLETLNSIVKNPAHASSAVHPNILRLIIDMVQLDRRKRIRDAYSARIRLENYLEYSASSQEDFDEVLEAYSGKEGNRNHWILSKLRNRLFDLSKRNRLIYFKKSSRYVNLTLSSVPYVLDYKNIRADKLFIWNEGIAAHLKKGTSIKLNKYLKIKDNPQIGISLKKVYYEGNRDKAEFGFNQLKLAFCFLNWYNYKENVNEKIQSPLLLIPVSVKKKKGINDEFTLELLETEAQVNPVLAYYLRELFDIKLPKFYDLATIDIEEIYTSVNDAITRKSNEVRLELVKKPRLRLIHSLAKRSFESYQKKVRKSVSKSIWGGDGNYSYQATDYRPLGLKLYRDRVKKEASMLEFLIDSNIKMDHSAVEIDAKRELYEIESDGNIDPYKWEFDLCNFTLGNFNYQRMTLVNDYDSLINEEIQNDVFDSLFSPDPKVDFQKKDNQVALSDNFCVIPADITQLSAIKKANEGRSYIIQGPPGTGKSQTIANLLANKVAAGKSILFISEKRAALDVVYARMSQIGLKDICTLIHDSQTDKKAFIFDIKDTYEKYSKEENKLDEVIVKRDFVIAQIERHLDKLSSFHSFQNTEAGGTRVRDVLDTLLSKGFKKDVIDPRHYDFAPEYNSWIDAKPSILQIQTAIQNATKYKTLVECPFLEMNKSIASPNSTTELLSKCDTIESQLSYLSGKVNSGLSVNVKSVSKLSQILGSISSLSTLKKIGKLDLLDDSSSNAQAYRDEVSAMAQAKVDKANAEAKNKNWKQKPTPDELGRLYKQYQESTSGFFNKLLGKKDQFVQMLGNYYDFDAHMIPPEPEEVFKNIQAELDCIAKYESVLANSPISVAIGNTNLSNIKTNLQALKAETNNSEILQSSGLAQLLDINEDLQLRNSNLKTCLAELLTNEDNIDNIYDAVDEIRISAPAMFSLAPRLREWFDLPVDLRNFILQSRLNIDEIEYAAAYTFLLKSEQNIGSELTGSEISRLVEKIAELYPQLLNHNSEYVLERVKNNFQTALDLSYIPSYELTKEQSKKKQSYHEGRATLENEFSKKIRYKSIREIAGGDTGTVVKDLKPVWMMSPLSVSDALPLESMFDIVIFDEASQITVEEGIPPLYRADQAIIVGDEMQMPPSDFFSTKVDDSDEDAEFLSMDAESLLNQGARKLPQVTLGWHYRSRQEALINFSNFAFYHGELMSIPDVNNPEIVSEAIEVFEREEAVQNTEKLLSNSITYHHLPNGVYQNRMNESEADYIAHMVRNLLLGDSGKSIGIVAFSMQQQSTIETALSSLAELDKEFAVALDDAYAGVEDEEFTGLFVKNLENVQGDERDIMILSICYGYSPKGRMLMNFGPINRRGGEKRLNVIFSRAKQHMAVVSSIKHTDITNESNEGANYLKKYLQYAELISLGHSEAAMSILNNLGKRSKNTSVEYSRSPLTDQLKSALKLQSYHVDTNLGQSRLKIDLGVKKDKAQEKYDLGIMIDHTTSYTSSNLMNEYYSKSNILEAFGWKIYKVYANDWFKNQSLVMRAIIQAIDENNEVDEPEVEVPPTIDTEQPEISHQLQNTEKGMFWNIEQNGTKVTIKMGSIGEDGVSNSRFFDTESDAGEYVLTQVESRKTRGFVSIV